MRRKCPAATVRRPAFVEAIDAAGIVEQRQSGAGRLSSAAAFASLATAMLDRSAAAAHRRPLGFFRTRLRRGQCHRPADVCASTLRPIHSAARLAPCRTFIPQEAAQAMLAQGLGQRVTPQDLLIFGPHGPIDNKLRFADECVRHKLLDVVGDLALTGCEIIGHVVAYRCGHQLHAELAKRLLEQAEEIAAHSNGAERSVRDEIDLPWQQPCRADACTRHDRSQTIRRCHHPPYVHDGNSGVTQDDNSHRRRPRRSIRRRKSTTT